MNPSYDNGSSSGAGGASNIPGVKPGVIASGPDSADVPSAPSVPSASSAQKDVPAIEIASETTPGLSLGSKHLFKKPRAGAPKRNMIVSGGDASNVAMPSVSSGKASGGSRGSKKGLIIGGILIVSLVAGLIAGVMVMNGGKKGNQQVQKAVGEYAQFYNYANYILNGKDVANVNIGKYDSAVTYSATSAFNDGNLTYFDKANELWKAFYDPIIKDESVSEVSKLRGDLEYQNELMDFVTKYAKVKDYTEEDLFKLYIDDKSEKAKDEIKNNYADLSETVYEPGKIYVEAKIKSAETAINLYSEYDSLGCIKNGGIDESCVSGKKEALNDILVQYRTAESEVNDNIINDAVRMLIENCFTIKYDLEDMNGQK